MDYVRESLDKSPLHDSVTSPFIANGLVAYAIDLYLIIHISQNHRSMGMHVR